MNWQFFKVFKFIITTLFVECPSVPASPGEVPCEGACILLTFSGHWGDHSWQNQTSQFPLMLSQASSGLSSDSHSRKMLFRNQDVNIKYANHCWSSAASLPIGWT